MHIIIRICIFLSIVLYSSIARAQNNQADAGKLFAYCGFSVEGYSKDISFISFSDKLGYTINQNFAVFIPLVVSEALVDKESAQHYDFQYKSGVGLTIIHHIESGSEIRGIITGMSTIGNSEYKYWTTRLSFEAAFSSARYYRTVLGIGIQHMAAYSSSLILPKVVPVVSIGIELF